MSTNFPGLDAGFTDKLQPPSDLQVGVFSLPEQCIPVLTILCIKLKVIRQLLCSAFIDQVAVRKDLVQNTSLSGSKFASCRGIPYRAVGISEDVFLHPSSVLFGSSPPEYIVFQDAVKANQLWLKGKACRFELRRYWCSSQIRTGLTIVNPNWLAVLGKQTMCTFGKPMKNSAGVSMMIPHFGPENWELPAVKVADIQ